MTQTTFMEKYPIYTLEVSKNESLFSTVDEIIDNLKNQIAADPVAAYIADFDHYAHTDRLGGEINPAIKAAKMVVFCFGQKLPNPQMMAARPRSIGVADMGDNFVFSFLEAPMSAINVAMEQWIKQSLRLS
ncbi:hypothetical protein E0765_05485 [Sulfuricurvum sp. IAE1]|uniref:DUF6858 family protein n=1 Tax=Sulfuricurvum sp. IAE1 TaxID=2546102 RepID=UPI0010444C58|nr:hypothetical protein [Sulfuricurvum sp. IAE1]MDX9967078.1 hypothetical protein [Sulfuricurvum sp.]TDA64163.1 hypothetical protein E0765_05485 [Sulfuricurvum sp. IAE1]